MKRFHRPLIALLLVAVLCCAGCANSNSTSGQSATGQKAVTYQQYSSQGVSYELPSHWNISQNADGSISSDTLLLTLTTPGPQNQHELEYFCYQYMPEAIKSGGGTINGNTTKTQYGPYVVYEYDVTNSAGTPVKAACVTTAQAYLFFVFTCSDSTEDYAEIYAHFLQSLS